MNRHPYLTTSTRPILAIVALLLLLPAALAHGGEAGSADAAELADQAIAFLQTEPPNIEAAQDRINDALAAEESPDDVNLKVVSAAGAALEQGAVPETVQLLGRALGKPAESLGPLITVRVGAGYYLAFAAAALLIGLGAYGLGWRGSSVSHARRAAHDQGAARG